MGIRYAIKEPQSKKFFARNNRQKFVTDPLKASLWQAKKEAEKALKALRKNPQAAIKPLTVNMQVVVIDTEEVIKEKEATSTADRNNTEYQTTKATNQNWEQLSQEIDSEQFLKSIDSEQILKAIEAYCEFMRRVSGVKQLLQAGISNSDKKVEDLAHVAELGVFNASKGYEISMELKRTRQQRRKEKDALLALAKMIPAEKEEETRKNAENCLAWLETVKQGRTYNFRDKEMEQRFGYLLKPKEI